MFYCKVHSVISWCVAKLKNCRGGMNLPRKIQVVKPLNKRPPQQPPVNERGVNPANLTQIKPVASTSSHRHFKCEFPTFSLSNAQSLSCCYTKSLLMWQWLQNLGSAQTYQTMHVQLTAMNCFQNLVVILLITLIEVAELWCM